MNIKYSFRNMVIFMRLHSSLRTHLEKPFGRIHACILDYMSVIWRGPERCFDRFEKYVFAIKCENVAQAPKSCKTQFDDPKMVPINSRGKFKVHEAFQRSVA